MAGYDYKANRLTNDSLLVLGPTGVGKSQWCAENTENSYYVLQRPEFEMVVWLREPDGCDYRRLPTFKGTAIQLHVGFFIR